MTDLRVELQATLGDAFTARFIGDFRNVVLNAS
jgi:hypothetical protein